MKMMRWAIVVAGSCLLAGCSAEMDGERRPTAAVTGRVTYRGQPVRDALVTFVSHGADPVPAYDLTDMEGRFKLTTYEEGDGAVLGQHGVAISKPTAGDPEDAEPLPPGSGNTDEEDFDSYVPTNDDVSVVPVVRHLLPNKYSDPATSGLAATVSADGENNFAFDLTD
jgi:hypothetical protein